MQRTRSPAEVAAEIYYDSTDVDRFHQALWGGEQVSIGLYGRNAGNIDIGAACHKMTVAMADRISKVAPGARMMDLGSGYGGAARYLAQRFDCEVTCLNISELQNERNRRLNRSAGLHDRVAVMHGSFEDIPAGGASVDVAWSQASFVHSSNREQVIAEINRVLKPGGQLLFTDQMQADDCPPGALRHIYERYKVESLASPLWYRRECARHGLQQTEWCDLTPELLHHYTAVRAALRKRYDRLSLEISRNYMDRMLINLDNWVSAAHAGYLRWGIFQFRKPQLA